MPTPEEAYQNALKGLAHIRSKRDRSKVVVTREGDSHRAFKIDRGSPAKVSERKPIKA